MSDSAIVTDMWSTLVDLVLPRTCPGCGRADPWCADCARLLSGRPRRVLPPHTEFDSGLPPAYSLSQYRGPVRQAIIDGKERGRRDLPGRLGGALGVGLGLLVSIAVLYEPIWLVPAPTSPSAARRRGGDPVIQMARSAAVLLAGLGVEAGVAPCLYTGRGARDSVGLSAAARLVNLDGRVRWRAGSAPPHGRAVVLIDDVLTTGATAATAAQVLRVHGHSVQAVVTIASVPALV